MQLNMATSAGYLQQQVFAFMKQEGTAILYMFNNQSFMCILKDSRVFFSEDINEIIIILCYYVIAPECYTVCYRVEFFARLMELITLSWFSQEDTIEM